MNKPVWIERLLSVGGVLEIGAGVAFLVAPADLAPLLLGSPLGGAGVVVARIAGAGLLSLGISCWGARKTPTAPASLGVAWGFLAYNVIACATLVWASLALTGVGLPAWAAAVLHGVLGLVLVIALLGRSQPTVGS